MSRSGYIDGFDLTDWDYIRSRGAILSALRGRRGQAFLQELIATLDAMPTKRLIAEALERDGEVCAIGAVGKARGLAMADLDPDDAEAVAATFGISPTLVREITYINDEDASLCAPEERWKMMRRWVEAALASIEQRRRP